MTDKISRFCVGLAFTLMSCLASATVKIWLEGETGGEYFPFIVGSDPTASDDTFLVSIKNSDYSTRSNDDGRIVYRVYIPEAGEYTLWGRIRVPYSGARPFDVSFGSGNPHDNGQWQRWASLHRPESQRETWLWHESGVRKWLSKGMHTLHLIQRIPGDQHVDKILLTKDMSYTPSGLGGAEPQLDIENPYRSDAVERHGQLQVVGAQLRSQQGDPVQLRGISLHGLQWFPIADKQTIPYMSEFFGADVVRLAMYVEDYDPSNTDIYWGGYQATPNKLTARVERGIEDAIAAGVYVIVDWHIHDDPTKHTQQAKAFFEKIAEKYGHYPNVIYEIANEPVASSWHGKIKPYAETVIAAIRQYDPDNIIVVGTPNWSQDVDVAAHDPLSGGNLMYAFHYYAATHSLGWAKNKINTAIQAGLAIFVTEWGSSDVGTSHSNFSQADAWLSYLNEKKISWINWSLGTKDETSSVLKPTAPLSGPWSDSDLTTAGQWLKPRLHAPSASSSSAGAGSDHSLASSSACDLENGASYAFKNVGSGKFLDIAGASKQNGANVQQHGTSVGGDQKRFIVESKGQEYMSLKNVNSGLQLDVKGASTAHDTNIIQWSMDASKAHRQFAFVPTVDGACAIKPRHSNKCLSVNASHHGANVSQRNCDGSVFQSWVPVKQGSSSGGSNTTTTSVVPNLGACLKYSGTNLQELRFNNGRGGCVEVDGGVYGKEVSIADSDQDSSCNLRGRASGSNSGTLNINSNWKIATNLTGPILNISVSNNCRAFKLRVR